MLAVVDYGMGNLHSVTQALKRLNVDAVVTADPAILAEAKGIVLPGVGAFGDAMDNLRELNLVEPLRTAAASGKPFLGICLGMQLLCDSSEEHGEHEGLGIIPGQVIRFENGLKVPHMGWNDLAWASDHPLFEEMEPGYVYFVHSYHVLPTNPRHVLATTDYGHPVSAIIGHDQVIGMQFHPEKSGALGMALLARFVKMCGLADA